MARQTKKHRSFSLILSGGGGRGLAHAGVLKALEHYGYKPDALVGVSIGAVAGATYALNPEWYDALVNMDTRSFPKSPKTYGKDLRARVRSAIASERALMDMFLGWGIGERSLEEGKQLLQDLTLGKKFEDGKIPFAVIATDLCSGKRIVLKKGKAADAVYASAALPGILPPLVRGKRMLVDGCYSDNAPVDVARKFGTEVVIVVDVGQDTEAPQIRNGFQAMVRAVEICNRQHAHMRFNEADMIIKPCFPVPIETLDFSQKRINVASGARAVRKQISDIEKLLLL